MQWRETEGFGPLSCVCTRIIGERRRCGFGSDVRRGLKQKGRKFKERVAAGYWMGVGEGNEEKACKKLKSSFAVDVQWS